MRIRIGLIYLKDISSFILKNIYLSAVLLISNLIIGQDYFLERYSPFETENPSPESFLGYGIGSQHTRHDQIVHYFETLAATSDRAEIIYYGKSHEGRKLPLLLISTPENLEQLEAIKAQHLAFTDPDKNPQYDADLPIIVNLAYNVHGNEPSSSEAALLAAYILTSSQSPEISKYLKNAVFFVDPTINPDGRDRHTHWANMYKGTPLVADPYDAEHNEYWPGGRTNHYWFDLNRDWLLAINPESQGKLKWYHQWYPNVVTDFHEMGTQSTHFFEPMKDNGSLDPIMPKDNYVKLNNLFAGYFSKALDSIGSLYFTKEAFDGTYPGYGSSYPDLQGGLGLLFEQASSRGHKQKTAYGEITFPFTIRNQLVSTFATVKAATENKETLRNYQKAFFKSAITRANKNKIKAYEFEGKDNNLTKGFVDKLLQHKVDVYKGKNNRYFVPTRQPQYRMVQTFFETYEKYHDSVYYDASAWSVANFYNIKYKSATKELVGNKITSIKDLATWLPVRKSEYAYVVHSEDYNVPALIHSLQEKEIVVAAAFKPFKAKTHNGTKSYPYGSLVITVQPQKVGSQKVFEALKELQEKYEITIDAVDTGFNLSGIDLGSRNVQALTPPKAMMLIGTGVRSYEAGEVWHLLDTRVHMPITKVSHRYFQNVSLDKYTVLIMVSGRYNFDDKTLEKIKSWVAKGNTLISIGTASEMLIKKKLVKEVLVEKKKDSSATVKRKAYVDASENRGRERLGGVFLNTSIDLTHPLGFGYSDSEVVVYKNNLVWLTPSKNSYATFSKYTKAPHVDGYVSNNIRKTFLPKAASVVTSPIGKGRVVLFADNPNFRGTTYGTNRIFLNAIFMGDKIQIPND